MLLCKNTLMTIYTVNMVSRQYMNYENVYVNLKYGRIISTN